MTDEEIIAVVSAHKEGKKIQFKYKPTEDSDYEWYDVDDSMIWDFRQYLYRVAPEPRKLREYHIFEDIGGKPHFLAGETGPIGTSFLVREVATSVKQDFDWSTVKTSTQEIFRKPREWWIGRDGWAYDTPEHGRPESRILVREVLE